MVGLFTPIDIALMVLYVGVLLGMGIYLKSKASSSIEDYFIGGRKLPWWLLGMSGMAQFVDIAGTSFIISLLFILGPKELMISLRGGLCIHMAAIMLWSGKWHRRSGCITGAEWSIFRFGNGPAGKAARIVTAIAIPIFIIGMVSYLSTAVGIFFSMFVPLQPWQCSLIIITIACIYTAASGFYGVVFTDLVQAGIILAAVVVVTILAVKKTWFTQDFPAIAEQVTGMQNWISAVPKWKMDMPTGYEQYNSIGMLALFYLFKAAVVDGFGGGGEPKYFGAKNDRECGKLTFMWANMMVFRWPLMIGCAILGIYFIHNNIPDQSELAKAAVLIKSTQTEVNQDNWQEKLSEVAAKPADHKKLNEQLKDKLGDSWAENIQAIDYADKETAVAIQLLFTRIQAHQWGNEISKIKNHPEQYPEEFITELQTTLGDSWEDKLMLTSYIGTINGEKILPAVIIHSIPNGLKGLILIALVAACMSTFDSNVNFAVGFMTRDLYQAFFRPTAETKELIRASWFFTAFIAIAGYLMAYYIKNIDEIWAFLMMGLGAGFMVPGFIKFYWWRYNGWGFAGGMSMGMLFAIMKKFIPSGSWETLQESFPSIWGVLKQIPPDILTFLSVAAFGVIGAILGSLLTKPTDDDVLKNFYKKTKPFGFWGKYKDTLDPETRIKVRREHFYDLISLPFVVAWQYLLLLLPVLLVTGNFKALKVVAVLFVIALLGVYIFWYRNLPKENMYDDA